MPTYTLHDAFCTTSGAPNSGDNIDMSSSTVLDNNALFTVNTHPTTNSAVIEPGTSTFNGQTITETGSMKANFTDCQGNMLPENVRVVWFTTADGNTYYIPPDEIGDMNIDTLHVLASGSGSQVHVSDAYFGEDNDQENCVCFASEMLIDTEMGPVPAGDLQIGDMVLTMDKGYQPVRWVYKREVRAIGSNVPVLFKKGSIGNDSDVIVSQKHRFYTGGLPEAFVRGLGNHDNHLIHAERFVNDINIRLMPERKAVTYVHIMFDDHELVHCQGTISESWQPTHKALRDAPEVENELRALFPELAKRKATDPGGMVRDEIVFRQS